MIFELHANNDGDVYFSQYRDEEEWLKDELENLEGTYTVANPEAYLSQFSKDGKGVEIGYWSGRLLIKGEIILPKIKKTIQELDL
jgi:hypothetical protein